MNPAIPTNPAIATASWRPLALLTAATLGVGLWSLLDSDPGLSRLHDTVEATISLRERAERQALMLTADRVWSYDALVGTSVELQHCRLMLKGLSEEGEDYAHNAARALLSAIDQEIDLLDRFKTHHSVYRKSQAAALKLAQQALDHTDALDSAYREEAEEALTASFDSLNEPVASRPTAANEAALAVRRVVDRIDPSSPLAPQLDWLAAHLRVVAERTEQVDSILTELAASPLALRRSVARASMHDKITAHAAGVHLRERLQFVLLIAVVTYAGMAMLQLRQASANLAQLNDTLESRVTKRTAELAAERSLLSSLIESLPNAVFWKSPSGVYRGCNEGFARFLGLSSTDQVIGKTDADLPWDEATRESKLTVEERVLTSGQALVENEVKKRLADGQLREVIASKTVLRGPNGETNGIVGIYTEVTELNRLRGRLLQAEKLEAIGQLSAGIAHEINTPIQSVAANMQFLKEGIGLLLDAAPRHEPESGAPPSFEQRSIDRLRVHAPDAVEESSLAITRVSEIVQAMRVMSHPGSDSKSPADLNVLIESASTISRNRWKYVAEVRLALDPELPATPVLSNDLSQVLLNLIVNSADAVAERRDEDDPLGVIQIRTSLEEDSARIDVIDDGAGIPEETIHRVFDPFFTTKAVGKGTGQGLSIAYDVIANKHGGRIECESTPGVGTTFSIWLPLTEAAAEQTATA